MFTSVRVQGYRSIVDSGELSLGPVTVLIGPNNTGKSSLLRALYQFQDTAQLDNDDIRLRRDEVSIRAAIQPEAGTPLHEAIGPNIADLPSLSATVTRGRTEAQTKFQVSWNNGEASNSRPLLPSTRPGHVIVPVFARRRSDSYDSSVRRDLAKQVMHSDRNITSRLAQLVGEHDDAARYRELMRKVLGLSVSLHVTEHGQLPGQTFTTEEHVTLDRMGEGVSGVMTLLMELASPAPRLFLIEEPETDLHPDALVKLLDVLLDAVDAGSQFVVSTHSDVVLRHLGSADGAKVYRTAVRDENGVPATSYTELRDSYDREDALRELGYSVTRSPAWLVFEEPSAEDVVKNALIPLFTPRLGCLTTVSAGGAGNFARYTQDLLRMVLFVHLQGEDACQRVWVIADGDRAGTDGLQAVRDSFRHIPDDHVMALSEHAFEKYYPQETFAENIAELGTITEKRQLGRAKGELARAVIEWAKQNPEDARDELAASAAEVIEVLRKIETTLADDLL